MSRLPASINTNTPILNIGVQCIPDANVEAAAKRPGKIRLPLVENLVWRVRTVSPSLNWFRNRSSLPLSRILLEDGRSTASHRQSDFLCSDRVSTTFQPPAELSFSPVSQERVAKTCLCGCPHVRRRVVRNTRRDPQEVEPSMREE
jgi:hypothetical protein